MEYVRGTVGTTQRREFFVLSGLREAFKEGNRIYNVEYAAEIVYGWNIGRAKKGLPYLPGCIVPGIYNWVWGSGENAVSGLEPQVRFEGYLSNSRLSQLPDSEAEMMIEELARLLGAKLGQEYLEFGYRDRWWPLKAKK